MTEDKIKQYTGEWIKLLTKMDVNILDAPISLYEYIKLREGNGRIETYNLN